MVSPGAEIQSGSILELLSVMIVSDKHDSNRHDASPVRRSVSRYWNGFIICLENESLPTSETNGTLTVPLAT